MRTIPIILILFCSSIAFCQNNISISPNLGYNLYHSDNSLPITKNDNWGAFYGVTIGKYLNIANRNVLIEASYLHNHIASAIEQNITDDLGNPLGKRNVKMTQVVFPVDFSILARSQFAYGAGPSFAISNHEIDFGKKDKISSFGAGFNALIVLTNKSFFSKQMGYQIEGKLRYLFSVKNFGKKRDLSGYDLDFFTSQLAIGLLF
ncbi:hypothetical protein JNM05_16525 [bacterium]|nr:hypothetical protein [bacterium]